MERVNQLSDNDIYIEARDILRIANKAVTKAKAENKKLGIPEFFVKNGIVYYILETGEITTEKPKIYNQLSK